MAPTWAPCWPHGPCYLGTRCSATFKDKRQHEYHALLAFFQRNPLANGRFPSQGTCGFPHYNVFVGSTIMCFLIRQTVKKWTLRTLFSSLVFKRSAIPVFVLSLVYQLLLHLFSWCCWIHHIGTILTCIAMHYAKYKYLGSNVSSSQVWWVFVWKYSWCKYKEKQLSP